MRKIPEPYMEAKFIFKSFALGFGCEWLVSWGLRYKESSINFRSNIKPIQALI